jgi:hypothetical protein
MVQPSLPGWLSACSYRVYADNRRCLTLKAKGVVNRKIHNALLSALLLCDWVLLPAALWSLAPDRFNRIHDPLVIGS